MNNEELREEVYSALQAAAPLSKEKALEIVNERLKDYPKQLQQFSDWFEKHSEQILGRLNQ